MVRARCRGAAIHGVLDDDLDPHSGVAACPRCNGDGDIRPSGPSDREDRSARAPS